jgi:hypothetical protein
MVIAFFLTCFFFIEDASGADLWLLLVMLICQMFLFPVCMDLKKVAILPWLVLQKFWLR